jgi:putative ABC transport system ATP-binding protein
VRELIVLCGPSDCGKSKLLNLPAALDKPDSGMVIVGGVDVGKLSGGSEVDFVGPGLISSNWGHANKR